MASRRRRDARTPERCTGDRGAVLVEFAFVTPLLFLILFGIIEFGYNFNNYQAVRQGVREGARQAVVNNATSSCTTSVADPGGAGMVCTAKVRVADGGVTASDVSAAVRVQVPALPNPTNGYGQLVVCAEVPMTSFTGLFSAVFNGKYLQSRTQMKTEKALSTTDFPAGTTTRYQETDPSGANWSWCTDPA